MEFYGLVGETLGHSLSPYIHQRIMELLGIDGAYKSMPIPVTALPHLGEALKLLGIRGVNVTIPYKEKILSQLDEIDPAAQRIGAVNTLTLNNGRLTGYNTDYFGLIMLFQHHHLEIKGHTAVILGTGGVAKAAQAALLDSGIKQLYLVTRKKTSSIQLYDPRCVVIDYQQLGAIKGDYLMNATPLGMEPKLGVSPVSAEIINHFTTLVDLIYNPAETEFLRLAKANGKMAVGGMYMLIAQAVKAQELWQDRAISPGVIEQIYQELIEE